MNHRAAFTAIELLVVITIMVILLALLAPALERVQAQANMAVCMSNMKVIADGAFLYAASNKGNYPYRPQLQPGAAWRRWNCIYDGANNANIDDRPYFAGFIDLRALTDPMGGQIDLTDVRVNSCAFPNYEIWFGGQIPGGNGLLRTGDRLSFNGVRLPVLVSDEDKIIYGNTGNGTHCSHPDDLGRQTFRRYQNDGQFVLSRYQNEGSSVHERGTVDVHHAFTDGSAHRYDRVKWNEFQDGERVIKMPIHTHNSDVSWWCNVPRS